MLNLGNQIVYTSIRRQILDNLARAGVADLNVINRILGTLKVLHALNQDPAFHHKVGELILEGVLDAKLWKKYDTLTSSDHKNIEVCIQELGFENEETFMAWLKDKTPNPKGYAPCGYTRGGINRQEKEALKGDDFDIHIHQGEFLTPKECERGLVRDAVFGPSKGAPLKGWAESIQQWSQDFIHAFAVTKEHDLWESFAYDGLGNLPCGQGRFWPLEAYASDLKRKYHLTQQDLEQLSIRHLSSNPNKTPEVHPQPVAADYSLDAFTDKTLRSTGRVPNAEGFSIVAQELSQLHDIDIFVARSGDVITQCFDKISEECIQPGLKLGVLAQSASGHWYALHIQKNDSSTLEIVLMDSLGDGQHAQSAALDEVEALIEQSSSIQNSMRAKFYHNKERIQFDSENCGSYSSNFLVQMLKDDKMVERLKLQASPKLDQGSSQIAGMDVFSYSLPHEAYYNQYHALGDIPSVVFAKLEKQHEQYLACQGQSLEKIFDVRTLGGLTQNPYYALYQAMLESRQVYWQDMIETKFKSLSEEQLGDFIQSVELSNIDFQALCLRQSLTDCVDVSATSFSQDKVQRDVHILNLQMEALQVENKTRIEEISVHSKPLSLTESPEQAYQQHQQTFQSAFLHFRALEQSPIQRLSHEQSKAHGNHEVSAPRKNQEQ